MSRETAGIVADALVEKLRERFPERQFGWRFLSDSGLEYDFVLFNTMKFDGKLDLTGEIHFAPSDLDYPIPDRFAKLVTALTEHFLERFQREQAIDEIQGSLQSLSDTADRISSRREGDTGEFLVEEVRRVQERFRQLQPPTVTPARAVLPSPIVRVPVEMFVDLVEAAHLDRLEEYRSDENIAFALLGLLGGILGNIFVGWLGDLPGSITSESLIMFLVFSAVAWAVVVWLRRLRRRAASTKVQMLRLGPPAKGLSE
jgi:hypothetical protein